MNDTLKLPVGIDDFKKIREAGFYYVDKTKLIEQLLQSWGEVTLFTRPRRFGKTLNMSMLKSFFEIGAEKSLFQGLYISEKEKEYYKKMRNSDAKLGNDKVKLARIKYRGKGRYIDEILKWKGL